MGVIANQCRNTGVAIPQKFPRTNRKLARAAIGRPLFYALFVEEQCSKVSSKVSYNKCHCEPVVLRAANQNLNDCQWQSYLNVAQAGVAIPLKCPRTLERVPCLSLWERCPAGAERAFYPLSRLRRQLPQRGSQGGTDCDRRESLERATPAHALPAGAPGNCNLICS